MNRRTGKFCRMGAVLLSLVWIFSCMVAPLPAKAAWYDLKVTEIGYRQNEGYLSPYLRNADGTQGEIPATRVSTSKGIYQRGRLPEAFDLREADGSSCVTSVKDQGATGLCWAYAALGACESNLLRQGADIPADWLDEKGELNFSEAALGWYVFTDHMTQGDFASHDWLEMEKKGITGGNFFVASAAMAAAGGVQLDQFAPFSDWEEGYSEYQRYLSYYRMTNSQVINQLERGSESIIKEWIYDTGAVGACFYSSDIFYDNHFSKAYYQQRHSAKDANHAILLVGWDDNYSKTNFRPGVQPSRDGAWLVRNSWGRDDSYEGYFWLSYDDPSICEYARFEMESTEEYLQTYQYDGAVAYAGLNSAAANVFTAQSDGTIRRVMFPNVQGNPDKVQYTLSVYSLLPDAQSPVDGNVIATSSGVVQYSGYKSVEIPAVSVKKGEQFSVVLRMEECLANGKRSAMLAMESTVVGQDLLTRYSSCRAGESFVQVGENRWMDVTELAKIPDSNGNYSFANLGNAAIKALVEPAEAEVNREQLTAALQMGAPDKTANALYRDAYAAAIALEADASQQAVDNAAKNLLAGLEREGKLKFPRYLYQKSQCQKGDVDENGSVELLDAYEALMCSSMDALGLVGNLQPTQIKAADIDGDGNVMLADAYCILMYNAYHAIGKDVTWEELKA